MYFCVYIFTSLWLLSDFLAPKKSNCTFHTYILLLLLLCVIFSPENVVALLLCDKAEWDRIYSFIQWVLLEKKQAQLAPNGQ